MRADDFTELHVPAIPGAPRRAVLLMTDRQVTLGFLILLLGLGYRCGECLVSDDSWLAPTAYTGVSLLHLLLCQNMDEGDRQRGMMDG